jgi:hypothetical protein
MATVNSLGDKVCLPDRHENLMANQRDKVMPSDLCLPVTKPGFVKNKPSGRRWSEMVAWTCLALFLVVVLPLFLCMGIFPDCANYQVYAQAILRGGVLERDVHVEFRPPMMGWVLAVIHWLVGWKPPMLRVADFAFVSGNIWLLVRWLRAQEVARVTCVWTALALYAFYLSTSEWCHCQPDMWMLLPALVALHLRRRQVAHLVCSDGSLASAAGCSTLEGLCWGASCLFKPYVVLPGLGCWLASVALVWRAPTRPVKRLLIDALGLLTGGLLAGGVWLGWLWWGGGWSYFWMDFQESASEYYSASPFYAPFLHRILYLFTQFLPWGLLHAVALPLALITLYRVFVGSEGREGISRAANNPSALLAGFYIGWLVEGNFIQYQFDYHAAPAVLVALALIVAEAWGWERSRCGRIVLRVRSLQFAGRRWWSVRSGAGSVILRSPVGWVLLVCLVGLVVARQPLLYPRRLALWGRCWSAGSSGEIQDQLTCLGSPDFASRQWWQYMPVGGVGWGDLERVEEYLREQGVRDGDVLVWSPIGACALYLDLDIRPTHRIIQLCSFLCVYQSEVPRVLSELEACHHRFVVSMPEDCPNPWADDWPVVFQSGCLVVRGVPDPPVPDSGGGKGSLDVVNDEVIAGWAWDENQPNSSIQVNIYDGSTLVGTVPAFHFRKDLLDAGIGSGRHAFSFPTSLSLKDGEVHTISVKTTGANKELGACPKTVTLKSPAPDSYEHTVLKIREVVRTVLPLGATVMIVSGGDDDLLKLEGRKAWHFPQTEDGEYSGKPADSAAAIAQLEGLRAKGGQYLLFPETAFWWLDHYRELKQHLDSDFRRVYSDDHCVIFQLSGAKESDAKHVHETKR